jgi:hypothetical protein
MNLTHNVFIQKLNNEAYEEFAKCKPILNSEIETKSAFYYFLYYDMINIQYKDDTLNNFDNILNDPLYTIDNYFNEIKEHISNLEDEYIKELKKFIISKKKKINELIKECDEHIEILKKIYINFNFVKFLPNSQDIKLIFDKKSVIITDKDLYNNILGEFFTRFLFNLIKLSSINNSNEIDFYSKSTFYNVDIINSYYDSTNIKINNFEDIDINFKYWFIFIILLNNLFSNKSNYNILFNKEELKNIISPLLSAFKINTNKQNKKNKKRKGGSKDKNTKLIIQAIDKKEIPKEPKKEIPKEPKKENPRIPYENIFNITKIFDNKNLRNIYIESYRQNIHTIFKKKIENEKYFEHNTSKPSKDIILRNPFTLDYFTLESILINKKENIEKNEIDFILLNKTNFDIYKSLSMLKDIKNQKDIEDFCIKIRYKLILLLYYLYNLKKNIYKYYFDNIDNTFSLTKNNNKLNSKLNKKEEAITELNEIKLLEKKKQNIKNNIGIINRDKMLLNIENEIKKLLVQKYISNQKVT